MSLKRTPPEKSALIFVHPSDELYGADRMLLEIFDALPGAQRKHAEFWLPTDLPHGTARLCDELERRGAIVRHVDLPILRRAYKTPGALLALAFRAFRLLRELRRARPALVYCTTSAAFLAAPVARAAGVPCVVGHVQELWSRSDRLALGGVARANHRMIAISAAVKDHLPHALATRTTVVSNATPEPARVTLLDGRSGPLRFVVASRWNAWKGHRTLLAAWDLVEQPGELVVLGGPPASGEMVDVVALAARLRHPGSVRIVGEVLDPHEHFDQADVVVIPSDNPEPFGLVAIEAFARARPVIASAAGGLLEIVTDGKDGWLFPPGDAVALADVLSGLSRDEATRAGALARTAYEQRFTTDRYAEDWVAAVGLPWRTD